MGKGRYAGSTHVSENKPGHSAQGEGYLEKNIRNFPLVFLLCHGLTYSTKSVSIYRKKENCLSKLCTLGRDGCSWGITDSWILLTKCSFCRRRPVCRTSHLGLHCDAAGSHREGLWLRAVNTLDKTVIFDRLYLH